MATDDRGRTIDEIRAWDDDRLEATHDYIQWLFPLASPSGANPSAPLLDAATIEAFRADARLRDGLLASFEVMLRFFGLKLEQNPPEVSQLPNFSRRAEVWLGSHNLLRITRILISLRTLGLEENARAFFDYLVQLNRRERARIGSSFQFWQRAMSAPAGDPEG